MDSQRYVNGDDMAPTAIRAALASGELRPWRKDASGQQWYERPNVELPPLIHGVSDADEQIQRDAEAAQATLDLEIAEQQLEAAHDRFAEFLSGGLGQEQYPEADCE